MELEDAIKSLKLALHERLSGPAIPSFATSWLLWNYKFVMIILSENTITTTLQLINKYSFPSTGDVFIRGILLPGITSALYIFLYPYPERLINKVWRTHQKKLLDERRLIEDEVLLTLEESRQLRSAIRQQTSTHAEDIKAKNEEINELKSELSNVIKKISDPSTITYSSLVNDIPTITDEELNVLRLFASVRDDIRETEIIETLGLNAARTKYLLTLLEKNQLISVGYPSQGKSYSLTQEGRTYLVDKGII